MKAEDVSPIHPDILINKLNPGQVTYFIFFRKSEFQTIQNENDSILIGIGT
jgi:hypothetical protein